jgi:hypothetical protein
MKTNLPDSINTIDEAKTFLTDLFNNGESFHPEDDAFDINWPKGEQPTDEECSKLNNLMADIYNLEGNHSPYDMVFDPCEFLLMLDPEYVKLMNEDLNQSK